MTSGERMVWAASFVTALANDREPDEAVVAAASCVSVLRGLAAGLTGALAMEAVTTPEERRAMVDDMLGVPR